MHFWVQFSDLGICPRSCNWKCFSARILSKASAPRIDLGAQALLRWMWALTCSGALDHSWWTVALTGLTGPETVGIPSTATIDKGMTGLLASWHSSMVPAQGVGSAGALIQRQRAGVWGQWCQVSRGSEWA